MSKRKTAKKCVCSKHENVIKCKNCGEVIDESSFDNEQVRFACDASSDDEKCAFCSNDCVAEYFTEEVSDFESLQESMGIKVYKCSQCDTTFNDYDTIYKCPDCDDMFCEDCAKEHSCFVDTFSDFFREVDKNED